MPWNVAHQRKDLLTARGASRRTHHRSSRLSNPGASGHADQSRFHAWSRPDKMLLQMPTRSAGGVRKMDCKLCRTNAAVVCVLPLAVCPAISMVQSLPASACWRQGAPNAATHAETFRTEARHGMPSKKALLKLLFQRQGHCGL